MENEEKKSEYEYFFLNEGAINHIINMNNSTLKKQLKEARKYCEIPVPVKDVEDLKKQIKEPDFLGIERSSQWEFSNIIVLDQSGDKNKLGYCRANFDIVNKWGYKRPYKYFKIIYSDDFIVRWIGYVLIGDPIFWLSNQNSIYRITYIHKHLIIFPNICNEQESVSVLDPASLDNVVKKYHKCLRYYDPTFKLLEHETGFKTIDLNDYFLKGFFYKGPKWNYNEFKKADYYSWVKPSDIEKKEITELVDIKAEDGLFKIEIINQTYPHSACAYLDLNELKIIRFNEEIIFHSSNS